MSDKCPIDVRYVRIKKNKNKVSVMRKTASNERFHRSDNSDAG